MENILVIGILIFLTVLTGAMVKIKNSWFVTILVTSVVAIVFTIIYFATGAKS